MNHVLSQSLTHIIHIRARAHRGPMLALFNFEKIHNSETIGLRTYQFAPEDVEISKLSPYIHLIILSWLVSPIFDFFTKVWPTDQRTNGRTNGWTHPLIEVRGASKNGISRECSGLSPWFSVCKYTSLRHFENVTFKKIHSCTSAQPTYQPTRPHTRP